MKRNNKKRILLFVALFLIVALPTFYFGFDGKQVIDNIINNTSKKSSTYTIHFYRNLDENDTMVYDVNFTQYTSAEVKAGAPSENTFAFPNEWSKPGYVLRGWSAFRNGKAEDGKEYILPLVVYGDTTADLRSLYGDTYYAIWEPVNKKYGNVVFIGDSYVNSTQWPSLLAEELGIGNSYTTIHKPGTGFLLSVPPVGEMKKVSANPMVFQDYVKIADRLIGNNDDVYWFIILAGYNDISFSAESIYTAIQQFNAEVQTRFPNAHVAIGMAGTNFKQQDKETTLLTTTTTGYKNGIVDFGYKGHYVTPTINGTTLDSISSQLRWYGDLEVPNSLEHGCTTASYNNETETPANCYYYIEDMDSGSYANYPTNKHTLHPTKKAGRLIAKWAGDYLKTQNVPTSINYTYTDLKSLSVGGYNINFSANTTSYAITVPYNTNSLTVSATAKEPSSTVTGTGTITLNSSSQTINVTVRDINNSTKTYKISVTKEAAPSNDATLKSLSVSGTNVGFTESFSSSKEDYYMTVVRGENNTFTINGQTNESHATVTGLGQKTATANTDYEIKVTAQDTTTIKKYYVHVTVTDPQPVYSNDVRLKSITSTGSIVEEEVTDTRKTYNVRVSSKYKNYGLVIKSMDEDATLTFRPKNGYIIKAATGEVSVSGTLTNSSEDYEVIVTAEDDITEKTYDIRIYYDPSLSTDASISNVTVEGCTADSANDYSRNRITFYCPTNISNINIGVQASESHATVIGTGSHQVYDSAYAGYSVKVTAQDGIITQQYTVNVNKVDYTDDTIRDLRFGDYLDSIFHSDHTIYSITVPSGVNSLPVSYKIGYNNKSVTETFNLSDGENVWSLDTSSLDGQHHKTYIVRVYRGSTTNADLRSLSVSGHTLSPEFNKNTTDYSINVGYNTNFVTIDYVVDSTGESNSVVHTLDSDTSVWMLEVYSPDQSVKKTYKITVNRAATNNADLRSLTFNTGTLSPGFNRNQLDYTLNVGEDVTKVVASYITDFNGQTSTQNITIDKETTDWSVTVTAANGTTKKTYNVTIKRAKSTNAKLKSLTVSQGSLSPIFDKNTEDYTVNVGEDVSSITITYITDYTDQTTVVEKQLNPGRNEWSVTITAADGTTKKTYTIVINRAKSSNAYLRSLSVNGHQFTTAFSKTNYNYTLNVGNSTTMITIDYVIDYNGESNSVVKVIEGFEDSWSIDVQAQNGSVKTYTININRAKSANADLKSITLSKGTLSPSFKKDILDYNVEVDEFTDSIDITYVKDFDDDQATKHVALNHGANNTSITITAQNGTTKKTYNISIYRALSTNADLKAINLSAGSLNVPFDKDVTKYTVNVDYNTTSINIEAVKDFDNTSTVSVVDLEVGDNQWNTIVAAQDGKTFKTYSVIITRGKSNDATLKTLTVGEYELDKEFDPNVFEYSVIVPYSLEKVDITAIPNRDVATVISQGTIDLIAEKTNVNIRVTAQDGVHKNNYTIVINKVKSSDATLKSFSVSGYSFNTVFNPEILNYTVDIPYRNSVVNINAEKNNYGARVEGNGIVNLTSLRETVPVTVTAEDGTKKVYSITFNRVKSADANLSSLSVDGYTLSPRFTSANTDYSISVPNETTEVVINATAKDSKAQVNGTGTIQITGDTTVAEVTVTAEDKATVKTYTVTINRALSSNAYLTNVKTTLGSVISPLFDKDVYEYTITTNNSEVTVSYVYEATGVAGEDSVIVSPDQTNTTIVVRSTSPDGTVVKDYRFNVVYSADHTLTNVGALKTLTDMSGNVFNDLFDTPNKDFSLSDFEVLDTTIIEIKDNKIIPKKAGTTQLINNEYAINVTVPSIANQANSVYSVVDKISIAQLLSTAKNLISSGYLGNSYYVNGVNVIIEDDNIATVDGTDLIILQNGTTNIALEENGVVYNLEVNASNSSLNKEENKGEVKGVEENPKTGIFHYVTISLFAISVILVGILGFTGKLTFFKKY